MLFSARLFPFPQGKGLGVRLAANHSSSDSAPPLRHPERSRGTPDPRRSYCERRLFVAVSQWHLPSGGASARCRRRPPERPSRFFATAAYAQNDKCRGSLFFQSSRAQRRISTDVPTASVSHAPRIRHESSGVNCSPLLRRIRHGIRIRVVHCQNTPPLPTSSESSRPRPLGENKFSGTKLSVDPHPLKNHNGWYKIGLSVSTRSGHFCALLHRCNKAPRAESRLHQECPDPC
jgi:hypothetical protein